MPETIITCVLQDETLSLPRRSGWAIPDDALTLIEQLVADHRPGLIVEAGSGRSTVAVAAMLRAHDHGWLVSLEHRRETFDEVRESLLANELAGYADVILARLEPHGQPDVLGDRWYAHDAWAEALLRPIDMLIVDGPPGHTSAFARGPAYPLLETRLAHDAIVVLDDTYRAPERAIFERWGLAAPVYVQHSRGGLSWGRHR